MSRLPELPALRPVDLIAWEVIQETHAEAQSRKDCCIEKNDERLFVFKG